MAGSSNDCNPEQRPSVWLCQEPQALSDKVPSWLTSYEQTVLAKLGGPRRREYLSSRWLIRQAIAGASGTPADCCSPVDGRPVASATPAGIHLSLSHSHGLSACAASALPGLGLDIEPLHRHPHWQKVVRRWFTPQEQDWLLKAGNNQDFLKVWTLKEAWLKATGRGIAGNLQTLEVSADYQLAGDQPESDWRASTGTLKGCLVALVYRNGNGSLPKGFFLDPGEGKLENEPPSESSASIDWQFHTTIQPGRTCDHG